MRAGTKSRETSLPYAPSGSTWTSASDALLTGAAPLLRRVCPNHVAEHFVHRVTDCAEGNQSRLLSAQNVPLCTKCSVTCDRPWPAGGDGAGHGAGAGFVRPPGLPVGYLGRIRRHGGRHGLRRLRAQAIRAAHVGTGDGVTGAGGVVRDDRRTRRQKTGDGQAHLLLGAPEESRIRRQNGGRGSPPGLCYC